MLKENDKKLKKMVNKKAVITNSNSKINCNTNKKTDIDIDSKSKSNTNIKMEKVKAVIIEFIEFIKKPIKIMILSVITWIGIGGQIIYCDGEGEGQNSNSSSSSSNTNTITNTNTNTTTNSSSNSSESQENVYTSTISIAKGMIKEAAQGITEGIVSVVPAVIGGMAGTSLGSTVIKASGKLPPAQKAALGVATAVAGGVGITIGTGLGREYVKAVCEGKNVGSSESSGSGSNVGGSKGVDGYIPSILEDELSPLQMILNYELLSCILIFVHIIIIILIQLHKKFFNSGLKIISKLFSPKTIEKYEKFKKMTENLGNNYLKLLIIINVIFMLLNLFIITFVNVELSNNIDTYILVHLKMKENVSMLLLVKSNFSTNNNKKEKFKNFNLRSRTKKLRIVLKSKLKMVKNI